jgi:hypothetical protein
MKTLKEIEEHERIQKKFAKWWIENNRELRKKVIEERLKDTKMNKLKLFFMESEIMKEVEDRARELFKKEIE